LGSPFAVLTAITTGRLGGVDEDAPELTLHPIYGTVASEASP
jgi:hypothetical protein